MDTFHLEILSPERSFFEGEAKSLVLPIQDGMLGIMANHLPLTCAILDGEIKFTTAEGETVICAVENGMADVENNRVTVLCESAIHPHEIDEELEKRRLDNATIERSKIASEKDFKMWQLSFNKTVNRLKVKKHGSQINNK